jgi:surface polysaccharide O-acyltransferase-like enzyme
VENEHKLARASGRSSEYSARDKNSAELLVPVDLIRAVAIVIVIVIHATDLFSYSFIPNDVSSWWVSDIFKSVGYLGVPLFVILSGTLLLNPSKIDEPLRVFFRKRLNRIALPFLFWGMAYFAWRRFAIHEVVTVDSIWRGFLGSYPYPYSHFWFLYMLIGLYLVTPILRVVVHAGSKILRYGILLWFVGTAVMPLLSRFALFYLGSGILIVSGWVGYFVLGAYLGTVRVRSRRLYALALFLGILWTAVGTWLLTISAGGHLDQFFYDYLSANVILASIGLFMLLRSAPTNRLESRFPRANRLFHLVGLYSFAIYLLHPMVLDVFGLKGLFGFTLGITTLNPILGIPLLSLITLIVSFGLVWLLRKVPMLNKAIG